MATTSIAPGRGLDIVNLLKFPSKSKGLSEYKPKLHIAETYAKPIPKPSPSSRSPPRKAARLEGDLDHTSSGSRSRDKGKRKQRADSDDGSGDGIKKFTVSDPPVSDMSDSYFDSLLRIIHKGIHAALVRPHLDLSTAPEANTFIYEDVFKATRTIVITAGRGQWLYDKLKFELREAACLINKQLNSSDNVRNTEWLESLVEFTTWFGECVRLLEMLLAYLDRIFVPLKADNMHIRQLAMQLFKAHVFQNDRILFYIKQSVQEWASYERRERSQHPQRPVIVQLVGILSEYSLFSELFLEPYIDVTRSFYSDESKQLAITLKQDQNAFLANCAERLHEEERRSSEVLVAFECDWGEIQKTAEKALLESRLRWLSLGISSSVDNKNIEGLFRMYSLFGRVDGHEILCEAFKVHVHNRVSSIVNDKEHDDEMVDLLLDFKGFIDTALGEAFSGNKLFKNASNDAFATGFRLRTITPAEMIAKYLDREMRRGQKGASDEDFSRKLDAVLGLYRFTRDKDVFRTFYHRALAKRLLLQRSASDDFEKSVLKTLKEHYDPEFSMGDNMFRDLVLSRDLMREFQERDAASGTGSSERLSAMVLEAAFWPFSTKRSGEASLPPHMQAALNRFDSFYAGKHKGRKLNFDHSLGTASVKARFSKGDKELQVSMYQALVLLLFNEADEIGLPEIKDQTRIDDSELRRTLQSLACGKKKVLKKRPPGRDVNDTDVFVFNADFTDERARVHINSIQTKETPEETERTQGAIEMERKSLLDAAIVRIMKAKKTMTHQALVTATVDMMKKHFVPDVGMIKTRFEQLIEQEYMMRDEEEQGKYVYVA